MMLKSLKSVKHYSRTSAFLFNVRRSSHQLVQENVEEAKYPPIIDFAHTSKLRHQRQQWYDKIKSLLTVEEKLFEIVSKHNYYDGEVHRVGACSNTHGGIPFQQYITRTHVVQGLPEIFQDTNVDEIYNKLRDPLCEVIKNSLGNAWREKKLSDWSELISEKDCGNRVISNLLSFCCRTLASEYPHLLGTAFDQKPSVTSYWYHGQFKAKEDNIGPLEKDIFINPVRPWKEETELVEKQMAEENLCFQFEDTPYYTMRMMEPLPPVLPMDDKMCATAEVVDYNYLPKVFGIPNTKQHYINCLPGVYPDEPCGFPFLQVYTSDKMKELLSTLQHYSPQEVENGLGVMASFAWLNGLATHQGFSPFHDLTYPIVGQTILTNGQEWKFFVYQLNTICFHNDVDTKNRRNLCWFSEKMRLFETVENGQLVGLNDNALKTLFKFMVHTPAVPEGVTLRPYLGEDTRTEEEIKTCHDALRKLYRNAFDRNAFRHEIPLWVEIYKNHPLAPPCPTVRLK